MQRGKNVILYQKVRAARPRTGEENDCVFFEFVFNRSARQAIPVGIDVPAQVIALSLLERLRSRKENCLSANVIAAMSNEFGGHAVKNMEKESGKRLTDQEETLHVSGIDRSRGRVET